MKTFELDFKMWETPDVVSLRQSKPKNEPWFNPNGKIDEDYYREAHCREFGGNKYFLNKRCRRLMRAMGNFKPPYFDCEKLVDSHKGGDAFIFCPGPSLSEVDMSAFEDKLTLATNSAGFKIDPYFWVMCETGYALWILKEHKNTRSKIEIPSKKNFILSGRAAVLIRGEHIKVGPSVVIRWEENKLVPILTPAVCTTNALVTAWQMGCKRAFLLGMDLSRPEDKPYVSGVPFTKAGATNSFRDQVKALRQFHCPDMEIYNGSPYSKEFSLPFKYMSYKDMESIALDSSSPTPVGKLLHDDT